MSRVLKKLTYKYEYLKLELEELEEKSDEYSTNWANLFGKYFIDKKKEMWLNEETGELRESLPEDEDIIGKEQKPEKIKKLYRKLSTKLHPDKGGSAAVFSDLKQFYESGNLIELLKLASDFDIDYEIDDEDEELIHTSCTGLSKKIESVQATLSWLYFTGDKKKKLQVIKMVEKDLGIKIPENEYPEELRD